MKPALHRSLIFWSGILVMGFISWAWRDSLNTRTNPMWGSCMIESGAGALSFTYRPSGRRPGWECFRNEFSKPSSALFPPPHFIRGGIDHADLKTRQLYLMKYDVKELRELNAMNMIYRTDRDWLVCIPYWMILTGFTIPWLGLLLWRAKRRKRAAGLPGVGGSVLES
ncbi:hypothetical protein [Luteolibacter sp. Populi]|uniref:hypothetical protein n=1 Tax=Luteolibacter sp. Populi TaxID=3230487 RepID=UPI003465AA2F